MRLLDDVLDRATQRLRIDEEIRSEVRHELKSHLEDSADEYRSAGCGEDEAAARAAESLGDPDTLSEQIWQANRRRIHLRQVGRYVFHWGAAPLAAVLTLVLTWQSLAGVVLILSVLAAVGLQTPLPNGFNSQRHLREKQAEVLSSLAPDARELFEAANVDDRQSLDRLRAFAKRNPDDDYPQRPTYRRAQAGNRDGNQRQIQHRPTGR